jgi:hypothetical protein
MDGFKNYAVSTVSLAPAPQTTGVKLSVRDVSVFPTSPPFNLTVYAPNTDPIETKAEIVTVTQIIGRSFAITRGAEGTTRKPIASGYIVEQRPTKAFYESIASSGTVGPQGPQGIQGPAGAVGPQGPQGIPGVDALSVAQIMARTLGT